MAAILSRPQCVKCEMDPCVKQLSLSLSAFINTKFFGQHIINTSHFISVICINNGLKW